MSQIEMTIATPATSFDAMRQIRADGFEYWSARQLQSALGYASWNKFMNAINRAKISFQVHEDHLSQPGNMIPDHFRDWEFVSERGNGASVLMLDIHLSRRAAYLVAMNGDVHKPESAAAQHYFAIRTRQAEIADAAAKIEMGAATYHQIFMEGYKQGREETPATLERFRVLPIKVGRPRHTDVSRHAPTEKVGGESKSGFSDDGTFLLPGMVDAVKGVILKFAGEETTMTAIFEHVRIPRSRTNEMGVAYLLKSNGYERFHKMSKGIRTWVYRMAEHA